jgi:hypothetical protein
LNAENDKMELIIAPNPISAFTTISIKNNMEAKICEFNMYNSLGKMVLSTTLTNELTTLDLSGLQSGIYFYRAVSGSKVIQSGKLISKQ